MEIQFEGWARNHGPKTMMRTRLLAEHIVDNPFPLKQGELAAQVLRPNDDMADGIKLYFSTSMRLGGDQLGTIVISTKELMRMLKACVKEKTLQHIIDLYNDAPPASKSANLRVV